MSTTQTKVLFVCLGNICRSPLAEGAFREHVSKAGLADQFLIDSAGTGHWHAGETPDKRSVATARAHGVDISEQRARQLQRSDLERFDYILAMDRSNLEAIQSMAGTSSASVSLMLNETSAGETDVPDPYYGANDQFERVWQMVDEAAEALLARIRK